MMVNDLLDISKMESGEMSLYREDFPVSGVVQDAVSLVGVIAREKQQKIVVDLQEGTEALTLNADREKVRRVLVNLLGNAIKFTPEGGLITITARREGEFLELSVTDTGPGIAREHQGRIFDKFYQVHDKQVRGTAATGLGLTFCKLAVEAMGGKIGLESEPEKGSRFWFTLPLI
jgi:signal transduction histidine kinase